MNPISRAARAAAFLASVSLAGFSPLAAVDPGVPPEGPDVTINLLGSVGNYGGGGGFVGYSVGTTSCNIGDQDLNWCDNSMCPNGLQTDQHPVIAQGLYRLKAGRFEQVGASWLKHGFLATNTTEGTCKQGANCDDPNTGDLLGPGCRDTYGSSLNGSRPMGRRSEVNATTGSFPFPAGGGGSSANGSDQRIRVAVTDVDSSNAGALYWVEGHYVADNDALAGNGLNNASYRSVSVSTSAPNYSLSLTGSIVKERTAIHAWAAQDATVQIHNVDVPGAVVERFEVARKVVDLGGTWHYEIAIRNMNSDRSGRGLTIEFPDGTTFANAGFRDVDSHSGEPFSTDDWTIATDSLNGTISWNAVPFATSANANALRWATMYTFWFDASAPPGGETYELELFKPGVPESMTWQWPLFTDGFEAHNFVAWSSTEPLCPTC